MCLWWALNFRCPVKGRQHVYSGVVILTSCPYGDTAGSTLEDQRDDGVAASAPVTRHRAMVSWPSLSVSCCV